MSGTPSTSTPTHYPASETSTPATSPLTRPLWLLLVIALGMVLHEGSRIAIWMVWSFLLFAFLDPWLQRLSRRGVSPVLSALALLSAVMAAAIACFFVAKQFSPDLIEQFGEYRKTLLGLYDSFSQSVATTLRDFAHRGKGLVSTTVPGAGPVTKVQVVEPSPLTGAVGTTMVNSLNSLLSALSFMLLCPLLTFFVIADRELFARVLRDRYPAGQGALVWRKITDAVGAYFSGNFAIMAMSFPIYVIVFFAFGVGSPVLLAFVASVLNLIPFLVIAWGELWGGMGLLLAVPIMAIVKVLFEYSEKPTLVAIACMMSEDPESPLRPRRARPKA